MPDNSVRDHAPPTLVGGRYRLRGEVGRGGMATVHRAHDEVLDRPVAVKLLHAHLAGDPAFLDRFRREARAAAALSHPNVVAVHDWGETDHGPYLVLQLVDGQTLREVLRHRQRLTPGEARWVLEPAAAGLTAAHAAGLVHRDIKPENLLLGRDGTVRVTDFGLARAAASATSTFGADVLVGSPHYLAPEAVRGMPLDRRADVYALGVVLYECLTGRPPHEAGSPFLTAMAHTTDRVPPPSEVDGSIPSTLDRVVLDATAMDRESRCPDARAFADALRTAVPSGAVVVDLDHRSPLGRSPANGHVPSQVPRTHGTAIAPADRSDTAVVRSSGETAVVQPDGLDTDDLREPRRGGRALVVLLLLATLLGASAAGGYLLWDRVLAPVTAIPSVVGAPVDVAIDALDGAGFEVDVDPARPFDLTVPDGSVLSQVPVGDARAGSIVTLVLSAGPRQVEVAELVGATHDEAREVLVADGLEPAVEQRHDEQVPDGVVIATDPQAGSVVDEASSVLLTVSLGPAPIEVPDVAGLSQAEARDALVDVDLRLEVTERRHDEQAPEGTVLSQSPGVGEVRFRGDVVQVVVSSGPAPIEVPGVRGRSVGEAVAELESLGFEVAVTRRGGFGAFLNPDQVYDQDPAPGATRRRGDEVILYAYNP